MDITTDGFGFMLTVGDLAWVPFTYSLQARFLAFNPVNLGLIWTPLIFTLQAVGYWIFRSSNSEKDEFRRGRNPKSKCVGSRPVFFYKLENFPNRSYIHDNQEWLKALNFWVVGMATAS